MKKFIVLCVTLLVAGIIYAQNLKTVFYKDGSQKLKGLVCGNNGKQLPGVLILPAWKGIDNEAKTAAQNLARQGYTAFVADIYGEGNIPATDEAAGKAAGYYKENYTEYQRRISLALEQLKKSGALPGKIAVIGYCFGGTGTLEAMRAGLPVKGIVCIHGGLAKNAARPNNAITTKVLVENPAEDASVTPENYNALVQELKDGKADWHIITYANSGHTFTNPQSDEYNPVMAARAWQHTLLFLKEILR